MWYEDFQGGVEQGHLNLGQVGTHNSIIVCMYIVCMYIVCIPTLELFLSGSAIILCIIHYV